MRALPRLYKLTNGGKIQTWSISIDTRSGIPNYVVTHGQLDGKLQATSTAVKEGKNIGKSNETTALEQCELEAESLWTKQRDRKGYSETIPDEKPFRPMLAHTLKDYEHKVVYPCYISSKTDGLRCLAYLDNLGNVVLMSRGGKPFNNNVLPHIVADVKALLNGNESVVLDGELYNHDLKSEFQTIVSAIKRDEPSKDSAKVQYHIYDILDERKSFEDRYHTLTFLLSITPRTSTRLVEAVTVNSKDEINKIHAKLVAEGYEGSMIRNCSGLYKVNGRSYDLLKNKDFDDDEFEIIGAEQNKGKQVNQCSIICKTKAGGTFAVKPKGTDEQREAYWKAFLEGDLVGKMLTVRYFGYTTGDNPVPRFPIGVNLRSYE